jgi:hypothetical protein
MMVNVVPLREALQDRPHDEFKRIAREVGYTCRSGKGTPGYRYVEARRVKRELGIELPTTGKPKKKIHYEKALAIARAAGIDPVEVGL